MARNKEPIATLTLDKRTKQGNVNFVKNALTGWINSIGADMIATPKANHDTRSVEVFSSLTREQLETFAEAQRLKISVDYHGQPAKKASKRRQKIDNRVSELEQSLAEMSGQLARSKLENERLETDVQTALSTAEESELQNTQAQGRLKDLEARYSSLEDIASTTTFSESSLRHIMGVATRLKETEEKIGPALYNSLEIAQSDALSIINDSKELPTITSADEIATLAEMYVSGSNVEDYLDKLFRSSLSDSAIATYDWSQERLDQVDEQIQTARSRIDEIESWTDQGRDVIEAAQKPLYDRIAELNREVEVLHDELVPRNRERREFTKNVASTIKRAQRVLGNKKVDGIKNDVTNFFGTSFPVYIQESELTDGEFEVSVHLPYDSQNHPLEKQLMVNERSEELLKQFPNGTTAQRSNKPVRSYTFRTTDADEARGLVHALQVAVSENYSATTFAEVGVKLDLNVGYERVTPMQIQSAPTQTSTARPPTFEEALEAISPVDTDAIERDEPIPYKLSNPHQVVVAIHGDKYGARTNAMIKSSVKKNFGTDIEDVALGKILSRLKNLGIIENRGSKGNRNWYLVDNESEDTVTASSSQPTQSPKLDVKEQIVTVLQDRTLEDRTNAAIQKKLLETFNTEIDRSTLYNRLRALRYDGILENRGSQGHGEWYLAQDASIPPAVQAAVSTIDTTTMMGKVQQLVYDGIPTVREIKDKLKSEYGIESKGDGVKTALRDLRRDGLVVTRGMGNSARNYKPDEVPASEERNSTSIRYVGLDDAILAHIRTTKDPTVKSIENSFENHDQFRLVDDQSIRNHLKNLEDQQLVSREKKGRSFVYSIAKTNEPIEATPIPPKVETTSNIVSSKYTPDLDTISGKVYSLIQSGVETFGDIHQEFETKFDEKLEERQVTDALLTLRTRGAIYTDGIGMNARNLIAPDVDVAPEKLDEIVFAAVSQYDDARGITAQPLVRAIPVEYAGVPRKEISNSLKRLTDDGKIARTGTGPSTRYKPIAEQDVVAAPQSAPLNPALRENSDMERFLTTLVQNSTNGGSSFVKLYSKISNNREFPDVNPSIVTSKLDELESSGKITSVTDTVNGGKMFFSPEKKKEIAAQRSPARPDGWNIETAVKDLVYSGVDSRNDMLNKIREYDGSVTQQQIAVATRSLVDEGAILRTTDNGVQFTPNPDYVSKTTSVEDAVSEPTQIPTQITYSGTRAEQLRSALIDVVVDEPAKTVREWTEHLKNSGLTVEYDHTHVRTALNTLNKSGTIAIRNSLYGSPESLHSAK